MVEGEGFEPSKHEAADLQSAGFDRSPTPPRILSNYAWRNSVTASLLCQLKLGLYNQFIYLMMHSKLNKKIISEKFDESFSFEVPEIHISQITESTNEDAKQNCPFLRKTSLFIFQNNKLLEKVVMESLG